MLEANRHIFIKQFLDLMRLNYAVLIILLALMTSAQCQQTAEDWYNKGVALDELKKYSEASQAYDNALKECDKTIAKDHSNANAWYIKGNVLHSLSDNDGAIKAYDEAIKLNSTYIDAWNNKGIVLGWRGKYDEAVKCHDEAIRLDRNNTDSWYNKGYALYSQSKHDEAIMAFDEAIRLDPNNIQAKTFRVHALNGQTEYDNDYALKKCEKTIEKNPQDVNAWIQKGDVLASQYRYDRAIEAYDEAIKLDPNAAATWNKKCGALSNQGKKDDAIKCYDDAIRLNPTSDTAWNNKGNTFYDQGKKDDAIKCYDEAIRLNPTSDTTWDNKATILNEQGKYEEVIRAYDEAIKLDPPRYEKARILYHKAVALYNLSKQDEAIETINECMSLNYNWGENWDEFLLNESIEEIDNATNVNPSNISAWINKGTALHKLGKYNDAIKAYDEAIRLAPNNTSVWFAKAHVLLSQGQIRKATEVYNETSELCHPNATVWINEARRLGGFSEESYRCLDRAIAIYDESIRQKSSNVTAWNNKGVAFVYQARMDQEAYLGLSMSYDQSSISKNQAHASYREDKWQKALDCFDKAIQLDPKCADAWYNKGMALYALNDGSESIEYYEETVYCFDQALKLQPREDCSRLVDTRYAEVAMRDKLMELKMTPKDVDRVAAYA